MEVPGAWSNSLEPCEKPGMAGGEVARAAGNTEMVPRAVGWGSFPAH